MWSFACLCGLFLCRHMKHTLCIAQATTPPQLLSVAQTWNRACIFYSLHSLLLHRWQKLLAAVSAHSWYGPLWVGASLRSQGFVHRQPLLLLLQASEIQQLHCRTDAQVSVYYHPKVERTALQSHTQGCPNPVYTHNQSRLVESKTESSQWTVSVDTKSCLQLQGRSKLLLLVSFQWSLLLSLISCRS